MKSVKAIVAVTLAAAAFLACGKDPVEPKVEPGVDPNGGPQITLSPDSVVVAVGDGSLLTATIRNATGPAQYVSRDQSVATVNANGAIRAEGTGSTYVVATLSDRPNVHDSVRVNAQHVDDEIVGGCVPLTIHTSNPCVNVYPPAYVIP